MNAMPSVDTSLRIIIMIMEVSILWTEVIATRKIYIRFENGVVQTLNKRIKKICLQMILTINLVLCLDVACHAWTLSVSGN